MPTIFWQQEQKEADCGITVFGTPARARANYLLEATQDHLITLWPGFDCRQGIQSIYICYLIYSPNQTWAGAGWPACATSKPMLDAAATISQRQPDRAAQIHTCKNCRCKFEVPKQPKLGLSCPLECSPPPCSALSHLPTQKRPCAGWTRPVQGQITGCLWGHTWVNSSAWVSPAPLQLPQTCLTASLQQSRANAK